MQGDNPLPGRSNYLDFELEIGEGRGREYPVAILHSPSGEVRATMRFPFDELALDLRLGRLQIALLRSGGKYRRAPSEEERAVEDFGQALFDALLGGEIRSCYDVSLREAAQQDKGLRLKLRIHPPELNALPWEFMYDPRQAEYVCLSRQTPIVRYLESPRLIRPLTVSPPLRILGMISSPEDQRALDVEREKQRVERAIQGLQARGLVELEWLPGQTWRDLQEATWGGPWHVFHFIGHGGFDTHADEGFIALADSAGRTHRLSATRLGRLLADHTALRLVLLNACEGAKGSERDIFSSTASILVRRGIPAVLAMQYEITDRAAVELARAFYQALSYGMAVDEAVVVARKAISLAVTNSVEWGTPVLYMRSPDGVLFHVTGTPRAGAPTPPPSTLYAEALAAMAVEDWATAAEKLQAVLAQNPDHGEAAARLKQVQQEQDLSALYARGVKNYKVGRWRETIEYLRQVQALRGGYRDADSLLATAEQQMAQAERVPQPTQPQAKRWPWIGIAAAVILLLVIAMSTYTALKGRPTPTPTDLAALPAATTAAPSPVPAVAEAAADPAQGTADWLAQDTDGDGLSNRLEVERGTDPDRVDSDGDGLNDGLEVSGGLNPLNADTDGDATPDAQDPQPGQAPTATPPVATATPSPALGPIGGGSEPVLGPPSFCLPSEFNELARSCTGARTIFYRPVTKIYVSWTWRNVEVGMMFGREWYRDGRLFKSTATPLNTANWDLDDGASEFTFLQYDPGLERGNYSVQFSFDGDLVQTGTFTIQ